MTTPRSRRAAALALCLLTPAVTLQTACSPPPQAQKISIGQPQSGTRLGAHGGIAQGAQTSYFSSDETIQVAVKVEGAPAGTPVKVVWKSPEGETLGEETKRMQPGQEYMHFAADGGSLPIGAGYHAEISTEGEPARVLTFDIVDGNT